MRVVPERLGAGLRQGDGLGSHDVRQGTAQHHRAAAVDVTRVVLGRQHQAAARAAQRLVGGGGHHLGEGHRVLVAREHLARHQAGEVGHVDHQHRADGIGDLPHLREVDAARIGGVSGDDDQRFELGGLRGEGVVVQQPGFGVRAVGALVEHLARHVRPEPVGQVPARIQAHAQQPLAAEPGPQRLPVGLGQFGNVLRPELHQRRGLDVVRQDRPVGGQVRVDPGMGLCVGVFGAEQFTCMLRGHGLHHVDVLAARVETVAYGALRVLVAQPGAHRREHRQAGVVLGSDQLQRGTLVGQLVADRLGDPGLDLSDHVQQGPVSA